jgi:general secretion pathway protein G
LRKRRGALREAGFTLIELMIVITIILILIGMAAARYDKAVQRAKEAVLKHNLRSMREMIDHYTVDTQAAPQSIEDLHHAGYLREVPVAMTGRAEWGLRAVQDDPDSTSWGGKNVFDVYSKSTATALDGTKYSDW